MLGEAAHNGCVEMVEAVAREVDDGVAVYVCGGYAVHRVPPDPSRVLWMKADPTQGHFAGVSRWKEVFGNA